MNLPVSDPQVIHAALRHAAPQGLRVGGLRRQAQINDLIARTGLPAASVGEYGWELSRYRRLIDGARLARRMGDRPAVGLGLPGRLSQLGGTYGRYHIVLAQYPSAAVLISEHTREHAAINYAAKDRGLKVICVPEEVDMAAGTRLAGRRALAALRPLRDFLDAFDQADEVFCIGREETLQFRGFGIDAEYLPYFPVGDDLLALAAAREARAKSRKAHYLILGSATHFPTREGIGESIAWLNNLSRIPVPIVVAGMGTEVFAIHVRSERLTVLGAVSEPELTRLRAEARAVIIHQRFGNGALTRIIEMLIAGVPVIANSVAARSYHGHAGVHVYDTPEELAALLATDLPDPPPPARPAAAEGRFVDAVRAAAGRGSS